MRLANCHTPFTFYLYLSVGQMSGAAGHMVHAGERLSSVNVNLTRQTRRHPGHVTGHTPVAPPGFCNRGEVRYGSIGGLKYEVPQSRFYCLCISVALWSTALQCICRVIRKSSTTMKAHTYYIIIWDVHHRGNLPPSPWRRHCHTHTHTRWMIEPSR